MVSGAEKRRRRREAAAAVAASQEPAENSDSSEGETEPVQVVTYEEGPPAALPSSIDAFRLRAKHLNSSVKIITEFYSGDVSEDWDVAKSRLGAAQAGESLERFVRLNTKIIPLDPWENCEEGKPVFATGSSDPLTLDVIAVASKLADTTQVAVLGDPRYKLLIDAEDGAVIHRRGMWYVMALPPTPGEGLQLQPWERVFGLTARYTAPFSRGDAQ
ncbi:hypothetical protein PENSPDRAFT_646866 [Peniophora sp. CONT]|nr:hypothetical protein PENSPDRAFT_646866 [Peniophora sp. CONT]